MRPIMGGSGWNRKHHGRTYMCVSPVSRTCLIPEHHGRTYMCVSPVPRACLVPEHHGRTYVCLVRYSYQKIMGVRTRVSPLRLIDACVSRTRTWLGQRNVHLGVATTRLHACTPARLLTPSVHIARSIVTFCTNTHKASSSVVGRGGIEGPYLKYDSDRPHGNGVVIGPNASTASAAPGSTATRWGALGDCAACHAAASTPPVYCSTPPCQFDNGITGAAICTGPYALPPGAPAKYAAFLGLDHDLAW